MPSRASLELQARAFNIDASTYPNDSKLEQALIYAQKTVAGDSVKAQATLTSDATNPSDGETFTLGGYTYTFKTTLTGAAFEVKIGADAATTLDYVKDAVNGTSVTAGPGVGYGLRTYAHPDVTATTNTNTTQLFVANNSGTAGNSLASTETSAHLSFGGTTFASGANGTYYKGQSNSSNAGISGGQNV